MKGGKRKMIQKQPLYEGGTYTAMVNCGKKNVKMGRGMQRMV